MLTVLVGTDRARKAARLEALTSACQKKGMDIVSYNDVSFTADEVAASAGNTSLFGGKTMTVLSGITDVAETRNELEKIIPTLCESENEFILVENHLLAPFLKVVKKYEGQIEEFEEKFKTKKQEAFNIFTLTDAFSARNRSQCWALYRSALSAGIEPRELAGKIFWAVKNMLITEKTASAQEAGLHPFVYQKAKESAKNFREGELQSYVGELAILFHEALVSGKDLETSLEAFLLRSLEKQKTV
jgi:DNA polymerase III delta subunit